MFEEAASVTGHEHRDRAEKDQQNKRSMLDAHSSDSTAHAHFDELPKTWHGLARSGLQERSLPNLQPTCTDSDASVCGLCTGGESFTS